MLSPGMGGVGRHSAAACNSIFNNAPFQEMLRRGVEFIEEMNVNENSVCVQCNAGRGRSTTLVACYSVSHKRTD